MTLSSQISTCCFVYKFITCYKYNMLHRLYQNYTFYTALYNYFYYGNAVKTGWVKNTSVPAITRGCLVEVKKCTRSGTLLNSLSRALTCQDNVVMNMFYEAINLSPCRGHLLTANDDTCLVP